VDSSAWIALFSARDQHHAAADRMFRIILKTSRRLFTSNLVLAEIHRLLLFRAGIRAAIAALERIEASHRIQIEFAGVDHHQSAKVWLSKLSNLPITYTDAVSFAIMESADCTAVMGYDQHFCSAGFNLLQNETCF
jgi:predicted nucleic acid-binding protein